MLAGGEEKAQLRRGNHLSGGAAVELVLPGEVAQLHLALLHRADGADNVGEDGVRRVLLGLAVRVPVGDVVGVVGEEDKVVDIPHVQAVDDLLVEGLPGLQVLQGAAAQGGEQFVLLALHNLFGGENDVNQVLAQAAGEGLFQEI